MHKECCVAKAYNHFHQHSMTYRPTLPIRPVTFWDISQSLRTCTQPGKINGIAVEPGRIQPNVKQLTRTVHSEYTNLQREDFTFHNTWFSTNRILTTWACILLCTFICFATPHFLMKLKFYYLRPILFISAAKFRFWSGRPIQNEETNEFAQFLHVLESSSDTFLQLL